MAHWRDERGRDVCLEPMHGSTYSYPDRVAAYAYDEYPASSVLAGQSRRSFLESFDTLEDARKQYPGADVDPRLLEPAAPRTPADVDDGDYIALECDQRDDEPPCPYG